MLFLKYVEKYSYCCTFQVRSGSRSTFFSVNGQIWIRSVSAREDPKLLNSINGVIFSSKFVDYGLSNDYWEKSRTDRFSSMRTEREKRVKQMTNREHIYTFEERISTHNKFVFPSLCHKKITLIFYNFLLTKYMSKQQ